MFKRSRSARPRALGRVKLEIGLLLLGPIVLPLLALIGLFLWDHLSPPRHSFAHVTERRRAAAKRAEDCKLTQSCPAGNQADPSSLPSIGGTARAADAPRR